MKKLKYFILIPIVIALFGIIIYITATRDKMVFNDDYIIGNTSGNIVNEGLFCQQGNIIYFSNHKDGDSLYSWNLKDNTYKKLTTGKVVYINAAGQFVYYSKLPVETTESAISGLSGIKVDGLFRMNVKNQNTFRIYREQCGAVALSGNYLYYQRTGDDGRMMELVKAKIDGSEEALVALELVSPGGIVDDKLYYASEINTHAIISLDLNTTRKTTLFDGNCYNAIVAEPYIYYMDQGNNYTICRIKMDGTDPEMLVDEQCSTYNVSADGNYLYYQVDGGDNNRICKLKISTGEHITLMEGNYKNINVTDDYIFFQHFKDNKVYKLPAGESVGVSFFEPEVDED